MSSADPPDRFDRSAGAAYVNQPCGDNFLSLACAHDGEKYASWSYQTHIRNFKPLLSLETDA